MATISAAETPLGAASQRVQQAASQQPTPQAQAQPSQPPPSQPLQTAPHGAVASILAQTAATGNAALRSSALLVPRGAAMRLAVALKPGFGGGTASVLDLPPLLLRDDDSPAVVDAESGSPPPLYYQEPVDR